MLTDQQWVTLFNDLSNLFAKAARDVTGGDKPPTIALTKPINGERIPLSTGTLKCTAVCTDDIAVKRVDFYVQPVGGQAIKLGNDPIAPYDATYTKLNEKGVTAGLAIVYGVVFDGSGPVTSAPVQVTFV